MKANPPRWGTHYSKSGKTWLEQEALCYPNGGMNRRCRALFPDGKTRIVRCGIPDTFFSIPVRKSDGDGYITVNDEGEYEFRPHTRSEDNG